jgi:molybdopterin synthase sulfur carrier subunit
MRVDVLYFASLRDAAGTSAESVQSDAPDLRALYEELREKHGFAFGAGRLRASMDGAFVPWETPLRDGAEVAFLPPVSGG